MNVSYSDGSTERIYGDDDADMAKKLEQVMGNPQFQSATVHKMRYLPHGLVNNRANRRARAKQERRNTA